MRHSCGVSVEISVRLRGDIGWNSGLDSEIFCSNLWKIFKSNYSRNCLKKFKIVSERCLEIIFDNAHTIMDHLVTIIGNLFRMQFKWKWPIIVWLYVLLEFFLRKSVGISKKKNHLKTAWFLWDSDGEIDEIMNKASLGKLKLFG